MPSAGKLEISVKRGENIKLAPSAGKMKPVSSGEKMKPMSSAENMKPVPSEGKHEAGIKHGKRFAASQVTSLSGCGFVSDWLKIILSLIDLQSTLTEITTTSNETSILEP